MPTDPDRYRAGWCAGIAQATGTIRLLITAGDDDDLPPEDRLAAVAEALRLLDALDTPPPTAWQPPPLPPHLAGAGAPAR